VIDQEQTTTNSETENSEVEKTTEQSPGQSTSPTTAETTAEAEPEKVDLGTGKSEAEAETETEDTRTDEEKAADEAAKAERDKLFGAPEGDAPYEISGLPEGMEIDKDALEAITPVARKLDLSSEGVSTIAQVYAEKVLPGVAQRVIDGINSDVIEKRKEWEDTSRDLIAGKGEALKTAGGETINFGGRSLGDVQKLAAKALDKYAPAGFREWLDETGFGVHPQMIGLAFNIGKDIAEDREHEAADQRREPVKAGSGRPMSDPSKFYDR